MSLRTMLFQDFWLKFFALAVAIWIWVTVRLALDQGDTKRFENLPVLVLSTGGNVGDVKIIPERVSVLVRGVAGSLDRLQPREIHPVVDLTMPGSLSQRYHRVVVSSPPGVTIVSVNPESVEVQTRPPARP